MDTATSPPLNPYDSKRYLSNTQLKMFLTCGEQYRFRYLEKKIIPPGVAMIRGKSVHKQHEHSLRHKLATGSPLSPGEVQSIASDEVDAGFAGEIKLDEGETFQSAKGQAKDDAVRLAVLDQQTHQQTIKPKEIEKRVEIQVPGLSKNLLVIIDTIDTADFVRDLKSASKSPPPDEAEKNDQLTLYGIVSEAAGLGAPKGYALDYLINTKEPKHLTLTGTRTRGDKQVLLNRVANAVEHIEKGNFIPAPSDSWVCKPKWCGYWSQCAFGGKGRERPKN